jgi:hypothetical protein
MKREGVGLILLDEKKSNERVLKTRPNLRQNLI